MESKDCKEQGSREKSEALGQKRKTRFPSNESSRRFSGPINNFMRSPDLEALSVMRSLGLEDPGDNLLHAPLSAALVKRKSVSVLVNVLWIREDDTFVCSNTTIGKDNDCRAL